MNAPLLLFPRDLGKKAYRLKCRFVIEPRPSRECLTRGAIKALELFVVDMAKQGWRHVSGEAPRLRGPFSPTKTMTVRRTPPPSAREMLPSVAQGNRFRAGGETLAHLVTPLAESDRWEYEIAAVFARDAIRAELSDRDIIIGSN